MALTRAQLLSGNNNNGFTLPGQPQGVIAGPGISISNTGIISVDSSSVTGLVKLNDPFAYNSYVWPGADGTAGEFLQTDGAGNLEWATPQGFAVVTVQPQPAPVPSDVGELWFDCSTGTLNVYQDCVGGTGWFNVAQPGFPVLPGSTSAVPPFANQGTPGAGTQANPYDCTVTTVPSGSSTFIVNTVTVTGLAPFQYVPIVDLNAVTNLGRFSFSNYYANSSGVLTFQVIFKDLPPSGGGISYTAAIRVGYASAYIEAIVNTTLPLTLSGGSIAGTPTSGVTVAFTPPTASGGSGGYTYTYQWFADGAIIPLATSATFTPTTAQVGKTLSVTTTVTDSSGATASTTTTASSQTAGSPISNWAATGSMTTIPGGLSGVYTGTGTNITVTGCIESAVYTPPAVPTFDNSAKPITSGQTLAIRWSTSPTCGGAASGTPISGTVTDGIGTNSYNTVVNRIPTPAIGDITSTNVALNGTVSQGIASPILGLNTTAYVTYDGASTGTSIGASLTAGGPFTLLATSGQGFPVVNGQTLYIQQTAGNTVNTAPGYTAIIRVGDGTNTAGTYDEFTYFAETVTSAVFPNSVFTPAGAPNASPASVSISSANLYGTASCTNWQDGAVSLSSTGGIQFQVNGGGFVTSYPGPMVNGDTVDIIWDPGVISTTPDNTTLTGTLTDGTYTNTYTITVTRAVTGLSFTDTAGNALSTPTTSGIITPAGFNVPVTLTYAGTSSNALTAIGVAVGTGGFLGSPQTVNPGQTLQIQGTTGPTVNTDYGVDLTMGSGPAATDTWLAKTTTGAPEITPPTIQTPSPGSTGQGSPTGIQITASAYNNLGGAGSPQTSSNWEVYKNSYPLTSTNTISGVTPNASDWTTGATIPGWSTIPYSVAYGNGVWVAVGQGGKYSTSTNGTTWTTAATMTGWTGQSIESIAYSRGIWIAGGGGAGLYSTSTNGTTWTTATSLPGWASGRPIRSLAYGNGLWVAVGGFALSSASTAPAGSTTLAIAGCASDGFLVGDTVVSGSGAAAGPATILSLDNAQVTVSPPSTSWVGNNTQTLARDTSSYTAVTGSPFNKTTGTLTSLDIAKPPLEANTKYWVRARYATTNATATTSAYGAWSDFTTGTLVPTPGALYGGGYFAGQINDGGTIYNLVVAPVEGDPTGPVVGGSLRGQNGGATPTTIQYKTSASADTPTATVQNGVYGGLTTDLFKASALHPVFSTFINGATGPNAGAFNLATGGAGGGTGIGGYNDWYIPAKNELAILYFFLKPDSSTNTTGSGSNPNSVAPYTPNTNYGSGFPNVTGNALFAGGAQAFSTFNGYWSSSEGSSLTTSAWRQDFTNGFQGSVNKNSGRYARAVRRISA